MGKRERYEPGTWREQGIPPHWFSYVSVEGETDD